ncbi:hypothetical protein [Persicitalea sp.]|uniref:hypothetical protein n=1 Tax=Persicitalea sp. TaxID=3100273 RepID=UPI003593DD99
MKKHLFSFILIVATPFLANAQYGLSYGSTKQSQPSHSNSLFATPSQPSVRYQQGYSRSDGSYVEPHYKTRSNSTNLDNFSTSGSLNPYTQQSGSRAQDYSPEASNYGSGRTIHTGPRGGQYYINSNGNKTYVPKQPKSYSPF